MVYYYCSKILEILNSVEVIFPSIQCPKQFSFINKHIWCFLSLHCNLISAAAFSNLKNRFFNFSYDSYNITSSVYASIPIDDSCSLKPCRFKFISRITFSNTRLNKICDKVSPCLRPDFTCTGSDIQSVGYLQMIKI